MNVLQLIEALKKMPELSDVCYIWDGEPRSLVEHCYLARNGEVMLSDGDVVYSEESRPAEAPNEKKDLYWYPGKESV